MPGLSVQGEPQGWVDLGSAISTAAATLEAELSGADLNGAQALARSWYGPTSAAFSASWASRRSRYEQLIDHLYSAGRAVAGYGQRLGELQEQAWSVESRAIEAGLRVTPLGDAFMPPPEMDLLPGPAKMLIEHALADAAQGVEHLFADIAAAAEDLMFTLGPVATLLEEFCLAGLGAAYLPEVAHEFMSLIRDDIPNEVLDTFQAAAEYEVTAAEDAVSKLVVLSNAGFTEADALLPAATADAARAASRMEFLGRASTVVTVVTTVGPVLWGAFVEHEGVVGSLENHAGNIADAVAGVGLTVAAIAIGAPLVAAGAPAALVTVGAVVAASVVAAGVGAAVQTIVDHRHAIIHAADSAVHDVEHLF
jgi:hypothetical protein